VLTVPCVLTPRFVEAVGERKAPILCHFSMAAGLLLIVFTDPRTGAVFYVASTMVAGIGFGISFSLVADTAVGAVPESRAGAAGAIAETSNEVGNALGIALLGSLSTLVFRANFGGGKTGIGDVTCQGHGTGVAGFWPGSWDHLFSQLWDHFAACLRVVTGWAGFRFLDRVVDLGSGHGFSGGHCD
jgi:DHA2 family multidrug resistance protein-like MFS transporter